jgi:hypothetical protein
MDATILAMSYASGKTQSLVWDALGRLVQLTQLDNGTNGFNWTAIYDARGRRLQITQTPVINGVSYTNAVVTENSWFDPQFKYLELAVSVNGERTWKVMGPDQNGAYGGLNGVGGLEATVRETDGLVTPVINDFYGNVLATVTNGTATWNPIRVGAYGPVNGYQAPTFSPSTQRGSDFVSGQPTAKERAFYDAW